MYMYNIVYSIVDVESSNYHMTFIILHNIVGKVSGNWQLSKLAQNHYSNGIGGSKFGGLVQDCHIHTCTYGIYVP